MTLSPSIGRRIGSRPALWVSGAFLALTLPLLVGGAAPLAPGIVTLHVALLALAAALAWTGAPTGRGRDVEDLFPLLLMPALYAELPWLIAGGGRPLEDGRVIAWEQAMFHGEPARELALAYPNALLSNILHLSYLCYYLLIFVPPAILFARGRRAELQRTVLALATVFVAAYLAFIAFPVEGPRYLWPPAPAPADQPVRALALHILAAGSSRGTAFPSSHVAVATVQTLYALRFQPIVGFVCLLLTIGIGVGAVYGGFHYGVDVFAGAALGLVVGAVVWRVPAAAGSRPAIVDAGAATSAVSGEGAVYPDSRAAE